MAIKTLKLCNGCSGPTTKQFEFYTTFLDYHNQSTWPEPLNSIETQRNLHMKSVGECVQPFIYTHTVMSTESDTKMWIV